MRLYSSNHASCVGIGEVQDDATTDEALHLWRPQMRRRSKRVVVKMSEALVPAAFIPHKGAPPVPGVGRATMKDVFEGDGDGLVLWDIAHVRLAKDWIAPPATRTPLTNGNESAAYDDDADFFAAEAPSHVVRSRGKVSFPPVNTCRTPCILATWHFPRTELYQPNHAVSCV